MKKPFKRPAFVIANAAFILLLVLYYIALSDQPYIGIALKPLGSSWVVTVSDPQGVGFSSGVRVGDQITKVNGLDPGKFRPVYQWGQVEGATSLDITLRNGSVTSVPIPQPRPLENLVNELPSLILGLAFWLFGLVTWYKRPFLLQARYLFWLNWFIGLAAVLSPASSRQIIFARELEYISFSFVAPALVKFLSVFPIERKTKVNLASFYILVLLSTGVVGLLVLKSTGYFSFTTEMRQLVLTEAIFGIVVALWNLSRMVVRSGNELGKQQGLVVLSGLGLGLSPFVLLSALPILLNGTPIVNFRITVLFLLAIPASWSLVIANKYLPDVRVILELLVKVLVITTVTATLFYYLRLAFGLEKHTLPAYLTVFTETLMVLGFAVFLQRLVNQFSSLLPLNNKHSLEKKIYALNKSLSSITEDQIVEELVNDLELEGVLVVAGDKAGWTYRKFAGKEFNSDPDTREALEAFYLSQKDVLTAPVLLPDGHAATAYIPVFLDDFVCSIFLGHRHSHVRIQQHELARMTSLCYQVGQRLKLLHFVKQSSKEINLLAKTLKETKQRNQGLFVLNKSLVKNFEHEKKALARDVHDGPLQLGMDISRRLKSLHDQNISGQETGEQISVLLEIADDLNYELRTVCSDLRPPLLNDFGLIPAVESLCKQVMQKELLVISQNLIDIPKDQRFLEEIELAAYRFLQEGIANVIKHSGVDRTEIGITFKGDNLELWVSDQGKGFELHNLDEWSQRSNHFGIVGMRERITGLGGTLTIKTAPTKGVMLKAMIPVI